jgi:spore germination protein YaaH
MTNAGRLRAITLLTGIVAAGSLAFTAAPSAACKKPAGLSFHRKAGKPAGRLSWRKPRHGRWRVYRNTAIVGQTVGRSIRVAVKPGRKYVFKVRGVTRAGTLSRCTARLAERMRYFPPFRPRGLAVRKVTDYSAVLEWGRARAGDGKLAGYRVYRDGRVYRQVRRLRARVRLDGAPMVEFAVAAADTRGRVGHRSRRLRVIRGHRPPQVPGDLRVASITDSSVGLAWSASRAGSSKVVGYRVYRNGALLGQVRGLSGGGTNLAPATDYQFQVAAIDSYGYLSQNAGPVAAQTALPEPSAGYAHAFLLATTDESFRDLQRRYRQIGTVYPTYFSCSSDAAVRGRDDPLVTRWAKIRRIAVLPRFDCQRPPALHSILTDPKIRSSVISHLFHLVKDNGYQGINLDFEAGYASDQSAYTAFARELGRRLHTVGAKLSLEVSAKYNGFETTRSAFYDYAGLGAAADYVFVMNWGWHWVTSTPGAPDDLYRFTKVADYVASMPNKSRFVLGMPMFGIDWPNGGGSANPGTPLEHADVMGQLSLLGVAPTWDATQGGFHYSYRDARGTSHDVWYTNAQSVGVRMQIAKARGLGVGLWRLGREDPSIWAQPLIAPGAPWP